MLWSLSQQSEVHSSKMMLVQCLVVDFFINSDKWEEKDLLYILKTNNPSSYFTKYLQLKWSYFAKNITVMATIWPFDLRPFTCVYGSLDGGLCSK